MAFARYWLQNSNLLEDEKRNVGSARCFIESVSDLIVNFHVYQEIHTDKRVTILYTFNPFTSRILPRKLLT